jgi:hypothetical protein
MASGIVHDHREVANALAAPVMIALLSLSLMASS